MIAIGIRQLKEKLSAYIKLVAEGETILVTDRNRVVAELHAPQKSRADNVSDAYIAELIRSGMISPAQSVEPRVRSETSLPAGVSLVDDLLAERNER